MELTLGIYTLATADDQEPRLFTAHVGKNLTLIPEL